MALNQLILTHFRNLVSAELELIPDGFNLIHGDNGGGKTSLLEAVHFLSLGRSFRCSLIDRMVNNDAEKFSIFSQLRAEDNQLIPVGIERERGNASKIRIAGSDQKTIAELARLLPVCLINSQSYNLLEGPIFRRKYLDWGVFYLQNDFVKAWQRFNRVIQQRNSALRNRLSKTEVEIWTPELIESAILMDKAREYTIQQLIPIISELLGLLLNLEAPIEIEYQRGWNPNVDYATVLEHAYLKDRQLGYTQFGPHKADLKISINQRSAKDFLSRGQQKLLVCGMIVAQGMLLWTLNQTPPIFLIDDLASELDSQSLSRIIGLLIRQKAQVFVTAIFPKVWDGFLDCATKLFHVEHGRVSVSTR